PQQRTSGARVDPCELGARCRHQALHAAAAGRGERLEQIRGAHRGQRHRSGGASGHARRRAPPGPGDRGSQRQGRGRDDRGLGHLLPARGSAGARRGAAAPCGALRPGGLRSVRTAGSAGRGMSDGAFLGLVAGLGLLSIWWSMWEQEQTDSKQGVLERVMARLRDDLIKVGLDTVPPAAVPALSAGLGLVVAAVLWAISGAVVPSLAIGIGASVLPVLVLRSAARRRTTAMREVWPEAVDHVNSAIRAGLSLPEALVQLSRKGPEELRPAFTEFALDYQTSGD